MNLLNYFKNENIRRNILVNSILFLLILIPNLLYCFYSPEVAGKGIFNISFFILLVLSVYFIPFIFLPFRFCFILFFPLFLLSFLEYYHIITFNTTLNESSLATILGTNITEAKELISSLSIWIIILIITTLLYFILCFNKHTKRKLTAKTRKYILFFSLIITLFNFSYNFFYHFGSQVTFKYDLDLVIDTFFMKYKKIYPFSIIEKSIKILDKKKYESQAIDFKFNVVSLENTEKRTIFILVIGESSRYVNWQLCGYERETSPYLMSLNNIYSFSDYYSSSNTTIASVPFLYMRGTPLNQEKNYQEKSFASFYKELDYKTFLINNQILYNEGILLRVQNEFDTYYNLLEKYAGSEGYDENIFPTLNNVLKSDFDKKLIVIHTAGSHFRYNTKYPAEFEKFTPCKQSKSKNNKKEKFLRITKADKQLYINEYDNSILYNDYILWNIISKVDSLDTDAVVMFTSDHGQNFFDDSDTNMCHGSPLPYKSEFHVPFFMWFSDEYIANNKDKVENAVKNKDKRLTSENLFYTLINLSDVDFETNDLSKSIMSDIFKQDSVRRVLCPSGVYDFN